MTLAQNPNAALRSSFAAKHEIRFLYGQTLLPN